MMWVLDQDEMGGGGGGEGIVFNDGWYTCTWCFFSRKIQRHTTNNINLILITLIFFRADGTLHNCTIFSL